MLKSGVTIERLLQTANVFKGFKKKPFVLKQIDGKYRKEGVELKKLGISSTAMIRGIRETT